MGRIKKDHSGWRTSGLWKKFQYPKIEDDEEVSRVHKKKNTKKWCRGKVGIKHVKEKVSETKGFLSFSWTEYRCTNCNKRFFN